MILNMRKAIMEEQSFNDFKGSVNATLEISDYINYLCDMCERHNRNDIKDKLLKCFDEIDELSSQILTEDLTGIVIKK